jgi:hypothetical protein
MQDLEAAIHEIGTALNDCAAGLEQAQVAAEEAGAQARAARGERDRERARAEHWEATAAHWEATATEALEAVAAYQAQVEAAAADRDDDLRSLRRAHQELSIARAALAGVEAERDEARSTLAAAETALAAAKAAQATARAETEEAEARRLAAQKARRQAEAERDAAVGVMERHPSPVADIEIDVRTPGEVAAVQDKVLGFSPEAESPEPPRAAKPRLLHVAATLGHLLPDDMDGLLLPGSRVVRREGRLAVLLAMPGSDSPWAESTTRLEEQQAELLRTRGFRVEWSQGDRLAS